MMYHTEHQADLKSLKLASGLPNYWGLHKQTNRFERIRSNVQTFFSLLICSPRPHFHVTLVLKPPASETYEQFGTVFKRMERFLNFVIEHAYH